MKKGQAVSDCLSQFSRKNSSEIGAGTDFLLKLMVIMRLSLFCRSTRFTHRVCKVVAPNEYSPIFSIRKCANPRTGFHKAKIKQRTKEE
jgi:hypothetical protein